MSRDGSGVLAAPMLQMPAVAHALDSNPVPKVEPEVDVPTFDAVYTAHVAFVWRVLRTFGVADAQLEDAVQDVFLSLIHI